MDKRPSPDERKRTIELQFVVTVPRWIPAFQRKRGPRLPRDEEGVRVSPVLNDDTALVVRRSINLTAVIQIVLILGTMIAGWYKFDFRVSNLERDDAQLRQEVTMMQDTLERLNATLEILNTTISEYPLHRHIRDGEIEYPNGTGGQVYRPQGK